MSVPTPMEGHASDSARVYQTGGDQYIEEHVHHYAPGSAPLFGRQVVAPAASGRAAPDSVRLPLVGRAPGVLRDRTDVMERLRAVVAGPGGDIQVLHGMGGCGKTAVAHALFTEAVRDHGRVGLWVNASERVSLRAGMLAVAGDRGATGGELAAAASGRRAAADLVWHYLDHSAEPWLLVLDNADDPAVLEEGAWLRASPSGTVLVTTRHATSPLWRAPAVSSHRIGVLPLEDATQVLCDLAPEAGTPESARKVARRLGCLPLALTLAGSHLSHQLLESWTMDEYDRRLGEESTALVDRGAPATGAGQSRRLVGRTWQLSLDTLAQSGLPEATTLLRLLSFWAADPVPLSLLMPAAQGTVAGPGHLDPPLPPDRVEPALRALLDHSLAELVEADGHRCVKAHGVLLDSVAAGVPDAQRVLLATMAVWLLRAALPPEGAASPRGRSQVRLLAPHVTGLLHRSRRYGLVTAESVRTATRVARLVYEAGDWTAALSLAATAARTATEHLGDEDPATIEARSGQGPVLFRLGRYAEAADLLRPVHRDALRTLGPQDPRTLDAAYELQRVLHRLGDLDEARTLLEAVLDGRRDALGDDHVATLKTRCEMLELRLAQDEFDHYLSTAEELVADCGHHLGPEHLVTVWARDAWARGLLRAGRGAEAEDLFRRVLAGQRAGYGHDHPLVLGVLIQLSRAQYAQGKRVEAAESAHEVAEKRAAILGEDHPETIAARAWHAEVGAEGPCGRG
ncbi:tetratricopeptide repeat protein [Streptomyces sp. I4(2020)]|uniref:tetratricopeptide repeat protein n=1 Tax=Streptomyces sp. I4(2020) TaxID=2760981 RepID=UPI0018EEBE92|nr:tetratricopeptide repeat protein [Streptomyces sp. I4(2020)]MBJ6627199.1 tetratricopeptide repeat protein [Streptomyces sp. I4(2020)]